MSTTIIPSIIVPKCSYFVVLTILTQVFALIKYHFLFYLFLLGLKTLTDSGLDVTMEDVANTDHFSIIEQLVDGEYHLTKVEHTQNATKRSFFPIILET